MIYESNSSRELLVDQIEEKISMNPNYSANAFARDIGVSKAYLSLMLNGRRKITLKLAEKISKKLNLTPKEKEFFLCLCRIDQSRDEHTKECYRAELKKIKKESNINEMTLEQFQVISDWKYSAILEAIQIKAKDHVSLCSKKLGLSKKEVLACIAVLENQGLISRSDGLFFRNDQGHLSTPTEIQSSALRKFHKQVLVQALEAVDTQSMEERNFSGLTLSLDPTLLSEAKKKIRSFIREMSDFLDTESKSEVYQLEIQLFKLKNLKWEQKDV